MTVFLAKACKGELDWGSRENDSRLKQYLLDNEGKQMRLERQTSRRSLSQNNYYWAYLGKVERETGNVASELHEWAKRVFLPPRFMTVMGTELKVPSSTSELSKTAFSEYMDRIAAESGVALPSPEELEALGYISGSSSGKRADYKYPENDLGEPIL